MITVPELASEALGSYLSAHLSRRFRSTEAHLTELIPSVARLSLECIGNSDALYHNLEHTLLVTLAGHDILRGRTLYCNVTADDYAHVIIVPMTLAMSAVCSKRMTTPALSLIRQVRR